MTTTESLRGSNCSGTDGTANRVLTLANTSLTIAGGFTVIVNGLTLVPTTEYTITHYTSGSDVTFLNIVNNTDYVVVMYDTTEAVPDALSTTATTYLHVKYRLGDLEANLGAGSANIVSTAISGAQAIIDEYTGTKTGTIIVHAVADYAAGMVVDTALGMDNISVSNDRVNMAQNLKKNAIDMANAVGRDLRYKKVNG